MSSSPGPGSSDPGKPSPTDGSSTGIIERIWIKRSHRGLMDPTPSATLREGAGIENNADQGGKRQVTLISKERWQKAEDELSATVDPSARRANVLVSGIDLADTRGRILSLGNCRLCICGETRPCSLLDDAHPGLKNALVAEWGGGAYAQVLEGGTISVGDSVAWLDDSDAASSQENRASS